MVTAAQTLRDAAAKMRERAQEATPGPWRFTDSEAVHDVWDGGMVVVSDDGDPIANLLDEWYENDPGEPAPVNDAEHIASWHPAAALRAADLLDAIDRAARLGGVAAEHPEALSIRDAALNLARAYLGGDQ